MDGGDLWPIVTVIGVVVLGGAVAWAMMRNAGRNKGMDAVTEAATRAEYKSDDARTGTDDAIGQTTQPGAASDGSPVSRT